MNNINNKITATEAKTALEALQNSQTTAAQSARPPVWLNLFIASLFGLMTISLGLSRNNDSWDSMFYIASIVSSAVTFYWYSKSHVWGIKPLNITTIRGWLVTLAQIMFFVGGFVMSAFLSPYSEWFAYVAGIAIASGMYYLLHNILPIKSRKIGE